MKGPSDHLDPPGGRVELLVDAEARALLRRLPGPAQGAQVRVGHAVRRSLHADRARRARITWVLAPLGAVAGAAVMALGIGWGLHLAKPQAVPLSEALASEDVWRSASVAEGVTLAFEGTGEVSGDSLHPRLAWERGLLNVEVTPGMGIDLQVDTREANVRVIGTGFSVRRDAMGSEVKVAHGQVAVTCTDGETVMVHPGEARTCLPSSSAGLLGRARAIEASGADPNIVLDAVEAGLARAGAGDGAVRDELSVMRIHQILRSGTIDHAIEAADHYLESGETPRRLEVLRMVAAARLERDGCAGAMVTLEAAADSPNHDEGDTSVRDGCRSRLRPE